jgi:hypothetical protein
MKVSTAGATIVMALAALALRGAPAAGADEDWSVVLRNALGDGKDIELFIAGAGDKIEGAFSHARRYNKMPHIVDAAQLRLEKDRLAGVVNITIPWDGWVPADRKPLPLKATLDATARGPVVQGTYDLDAPDAVEKEPEAPLPPFMKARAKAGAAGSRPAKVTKGVLTGSRAARADAGRVCRLTLNCHNIVRKSPTAREGQGIGVALSFKDGRCFAARMIPQGSITDVAFTATVEKHDLTFDGRRLSGALTALVYHNESTDESVQYDLTFDGLAVGAAVSGKVKVVQGAAPPSDEVFQGGITSGAADPADALYAMTMQKAIPMHNHLNVLFTVRAGKVLGGFAVSPHYNNAIHSVDFSGVRLEGQRLTGALAVTIMPDAWIPRDHQPLNCRYGLDARMTDGELLGSFTGEFGTAKVAGSIEGATDPKPKFEQITGMTLKVENGVFGRAFLTMKYENGKLVSSNIWNNHDRGVKGAVDQADLDWSDEHIRGTLSLRTGHAEADLPKFTCKVDGILVGTRGAGSADTAAADGRKKMSTFWVALTPARE